MTMATRKRSRTGDQLSKLSDKLAALGGKKCIASYIRDEHGDVFMILMADGCPACLEAKGQLREPERSRAASCSGPALAHPRYRTPREPGRHPPVGARRSRSAHWVISRPFA